jgi:hypothetical protein
MPVGKCWWGGGLMIKVKLAHWYIEFAAGTTPIQQTLFVQSLIKQWPVSSILRYGIHLDFKK